MRGLLLGAAAIYVAASGANAQTCESYVGQTVTLNPFTTVASALEKLPATKGEYETTAAFEARVAAARGSMPETVIIPGIFGRKYLTYDADAGAMKVQAWALKNENTDYSRVFGYGTPFYEKVKYTSYSSRDAVVFSNEVVTGSYVASNAYGASAKVTKITRTHHAIYEGEGKGISENLFLAQKEGVEGLLATIPMSIPEAQALKASGKVAFVVKPKWPYYAHGVRTFEPKISSPTEVTNPISVIVADITCGLLLTSANKVVGAYETR